MKKIIGFVSKLHFDGIFLGRKEADKGFLFSLLKYGGFDEYHFFFTEAYLKNHLNRALAPLAQEYNLKERVKFFDIVELPLCMKTYDYTVLHSTNPFIEDILTVRNTIRPPYAIPVTGFTHSLSTHRIATSVLHILLNRPQPYDCIICSSTAGKGVMDKAFRSMSEQFSDVFGTALRYNGQTSIIPIGIDQEQFVSLPDAKAELGLPAESRIILSFGRISFLSKMDYQPLLLAVSRLIRDMPDLRLIIAGGLDEDDKGCLAYFDKLSKQYGIENNIIIKPNVTPEEKHLLFSCADIFVSPSDNTQETFGISIIEAMAAGLPVVASDWDGYKDLIEDGVTGYRIPTYWTRESYSFDALRTISDIPSYQLSQICALDLGVLTDRLRLLLSDCSLAQTMGERARQHVLATYSWKRIVTRYEELWLSLKQLALSCPPDEAKPFMVNFSLPEVFSHYPTRNLRYEDYTSLTLTDYGREALKHKHDLLIPAQLTYYVRSEIINIILIGLLNGFSFAQLRPDLEASFARELIIYNMQWLMKKGIVRI